MINDHDLMPKTPRTGDDWNVYVIKMAIHKCIEVMEHLNQWDTDNFSHHEIQMYHDSMEAVSQGLDVLKKLM